jgi:hypothetical protein
MEEPFLGKLSNLDPLIDPRVYCSIDILDGSKNDFLDGRPF